MFVTQVCRSPEGDGGGGTAGGTTEEQKSLTEEDVGKVVNSAVTAQLKRMLPTAIAGAISEAIAGLRLDEKIAEVITKAKPPVADGDDAGGKKSKGAGSEFEAQLRDMAAKLEASEKKAAAADQARIEADQKSKFSAAFGEFRNGLQPKVRQDLLGVAASHWAVTEGRLKVADDGAATLRVKRAPYKGAPEQDEDLPLAEAIPILLASQEAKPFIPAPSGGQQGGNGNQLRSKTNVMAMQPASADASDSAKAQAVLDAFSKQGIDIADVFG